jgi:hypothetical protein
MKFSDFVVILGAISFFWFNEGIVAKSPRWQKLVGLTEVGLLKAFTWRANADVRAELDVLISHFKKLSIATGLLTIVVVLVKSQALIFWVSSGFFICFLAWLSFSWSFKHSNALQPFAPIVGWSLFGPWGILFLDYLEPKAGFMRALYPFFQPFGLVPASSIEAAWWMFLGFAIFFSVYYVLIWIFVTPFAYGILVALKASSILSKWALSHVKRSLVYEVAVAIQIFAFFYFYWIGR